MNAEQALFILLPMIAVPLGLVTVVIAAMRRTLSPLRWFDLLFAVAAVPLLAWNIAAILAEFSAWRRDQPDIAIGFAQYPLWQAAGIVAEIGFGIAAYAGLNGRYRRLVRVIVVAGFAANIATAAIPLTLLVMLTLWPISRLF